MYIVENTIPWRVSRAAWRKLAVEGRKGGVIGVGRDAKRERCRRT